MTHVKIGIVGASWFSDLWYLPVIKMHPEAKLQAICSKNGESARKMAEKFEIPNVYSSYQSMIDEEDLDGICIVTPNLSHKEIALYAINKGLHVICEKPMAINSEDAKEMYEAASRNGIVAAVNFTYRENPGVQKIKKWIQEGKLGILLEGCFEYTGDYGLGGPPGWRGVSSIGGIGGVLQDLGSHLIDLAQETVGEKIIEVIGMAGFFEQGIVEKLMEFPENNQAADSVHFLAKFASGFQASFRTSWISVQGNKGQSIEIKITGTQGGLHFIASELGISLYFAKRGEGWKEIVLDEIIDSYRMKANRHEENFRPWRLSSKNEVWKWIEKIKGNNEPHIPTFEEGYEVQKIIDAVMKSAQAGKRIKLNECKGGNTNERNSLE